MVEGAILGICGEQNILFIHIGGTSDPRQRHLCRFAGTGCGDGPFTAGPASPYTLGDATPAIFTAASPRQRKQELRVMLAEASARRGRSLSGSRIGL